MSTINRKNIMDANTKRIIVVVISKKSTNEIVTLNNMLELDKFNS